MKISKGCLLAAYKMTVLYQASDQGISHLSIARICMRSWLAIYKGARLLQSYREKLFQFKNIKNNKPLAACLISHAGLLNYGWRI
jgi:hypothetical protein